MFNRFIKSKLSKGAAGMLALLTTVSADNHMAVHNGTETTSAYPSNVGPTNSEFLNYHFLFLAFMIIAGILLCYRDTIMIELRHQRQRLQLQDPNFRARPNAEENQNTLLNEICLLHP